MKSVMVVSDHGFSPTYPSQQLAGHYHSPDGIFKFVATHPIRKTATYKTETPAGVIPKPKVEQEIRNRLKAFRLHQSLTGGGRVAACALQPSLPKLRRSDRGEAQSYHCRVIGPFRPGSQVM